MTKSQDKLTTGVNYGLNSVLAYLSKKSHCSGLEACPSICILCLIYP